LKISVKAASANVEGYDDMDRDKDWMMRIPLMIFELEKQIDDLKNGASGVPALKEGLTKVTAELKMMKANSRAL
jgi:hypothetical protein